jgi:hypothetical protein
MVTGAQPKPGAQPPLPLLHYNVAMLGATNADSGVGENHLITTRHNSLPEEVFLSILV